MRLQLEFERLLPRNDYIKGIMKWSSDTHLGLSKRHQIIEDVTMGFRSYMQSFSPK